MNDVDALAEFFAHPEQPGQCVPEHDDYELADALLASDWLAAHDAALLERVEVAEAKVARVEVIRTGMAELAIEKPGLSWGADYFAEELGHALDDTDPEANQ